MSGASFPEPRSFYRIKEEQKEKNDIDLDIRIDKYLTDDQKKAYEDQKAAYKSEIKRFKNQIANNSAEIVELNRNIHNLKINSFNKKLELIYGASMASIGISCFPALLVFLGNVNIIPIVYGITLSSSMLISNTFLLRRFSKNKKYLKEEFNITKEKEIQDKKLELQLRKEVLEYRNEIYNKIIVKLEREYNELCKSGIPREIQQKVYNEEEMNTNNVRGTRAIKNSIYTLEAEQEKDFRELDNMNKVSAIKDIKYNSKFILGLDDVFEYGVSSTFLLSLMMVLGIQLGYSVPAWTLLGALGVGVAFSSLKLHGIRNRLKAIKRKFCELGIKEYRYKELAERKEQEKRLQIEYSFMSKEKELINENIELKYSERKKQEFESKHRELYREEKIEQIEEKPLVLKMK